MVDQVKIVVLTLGAGVMMGEAWGDSLSDGFAILCALVVTQKCAQVFINLFTEGVSILRYALKNTLP